MTIFYNMCTKSRPKYFLTITLKVDNKFTSNLADGVSDNFVATRHKKFPLHLTYICTLPCQSTEGNEEE